MREDYIEVNDDAFVVIDFGIEHLEDGDWMWVECENKYGDVHTYWKKRNENSNDYE